MRRLLNYSGVIIAIYFVFYSFIIPVHGSQKVYNSSITDQPWQEVVISVRDLEGIEAFFTEIGKYDVLWRGFADKSEISFLGVSTEINENVTAESLLLGHKKFPTGQIRLIKFNNAGKQKPMRPGGHAWDSGCYFSLMVRMKNIEKIYEDAIELGWWTETPITPLDFGASKLKVVIFRGPQGIQIQGYERLSPSLPETIPDFDILSAPFNIMQMVRNRNHSFKFFTEKLGFHTFYHGKPYVSKKPKPMPIGIPANITTQSRYVASIVSPKPGEFGRMEMIETMDLKGYDFSKNCVAPNYGILSVRFPVRDIKTTKQLLLKRGVNIDHESSKIYIPKLGLLDALSINTPDGARIEFYKPQ